MKAEMGKTFRNFRDENRSQSRGNRPVTRLQKAIDKYKKHIYTEASLKEDLDDDFDEEVLDNASNHIQRKYEE